MGGNNMKKILVIFIVVLVVVMLVLAVIFTSTQEKSKSKNNMPTAIIDSPKDGDVFSINDEIEFSAKSSSDPNNDELTYQWYSNISKDFGYDEFFNYSLHVGTHELTLTVTDNYGAENFTIIRIIVYPLPIVIINSPNEDQDYYSTELVFFNGSNCGSKFSTKLNYTWISDLDGVLGNSTILSTNLSIGFHEITLVVNDGLSSNQEQIMINIIENQVPIVKITSPKYNDLFQIPTEILFDGSDCIDPDDHKLYYNWTSNLDGLIGTEEHFLTNLSAGTHIITLEINDGYGCFSKVSTIVTINTPPVANAGENLRVERDKKVIFDGSNSTDLDGDELTYTWNFGDGNVGIGKKVIHTFKHEGIFNVTLSVNDGKNGIDNDSIEVEVVYIFRGSGIYGYVYDNETFEPLKNVEINAFSWDTNDGYFDNWTTTNETGYYEFHTPEGFFWLDCYLYNYYPFYTNVSVFEEVGIKKDIYLDKIPPETAKIFGFVYDNKTKEPLIDADIYLNDDSFQYSNWTWTDENGSYEIMAPVGEYTLECRYWSWETEYELFVTRITLEDYESVRLDLYLLREKPIETNITFEFFPTNWNRVTMTYTSISYTDDYHLREDMDQNEDGEVTEPEVTAYELHMELFFDTNSHYYYSNESFMVDNITYLYVTNTIDYEYEGATGLVSSNNPITTKYSMELKSNQTITISNSHNITIEVQHDSSWEVFVYYVKLPSDFELTNSIADENITVSGSNLVKIDPLREPDWWPWWSYVILEATK
jgi:hypothetical protein